MNFNDTKSWIHIKIFFEDGQEHETNITRDQLVNIATPEEIEKFEMFENIKKYNL